MSLGVVVKSPAGVVMAADSRVTLTVTQVVTGDKFQVHYDNATKLMRFNPPHNFVAVVTFGQATVPGTRRTAESFLPELEAQLPKKRQSVKKVAEELAAFYLGQWPTPHPPGNMPFYIAGFDENDPYAHVFELSIPTKTAPTELHVDSFGIAWGGQREIVDRVIKGYQEGLEKAIEAKLGLNAAQMADLLQLLQEQQLAIPTDVMALQDCVDLAITLVGTTIRVQQLAIQLRGVGGPVDVVTITRTEGVQIVQFKEVTGGD